MPKKSKIKDEEALAAFVFTGKIVKMNAALMEDVITKNTLIAEIVHIIKAPSMFNSITGQQITVRFKTLPKLKKGALLTIFANGWIFGKTIAVDAVSYSEAVEKEQAAAELSLSITAHSDDVLKERIKSSELVVAGTVVKVEKASVPVAPVALKASNDNSVTTHISEHDPDWHNAVIQVDEVVKGSKTKKVKVLFPMSDDVRWYKVNKYEPGQHGVWLLQPGKDQNPKGVPPKLLAAIPEADVYTTLHSDDYLPLHDLGKVKSLIQK